MPDRIKGVAVAWLGGWPHPATGLESVHHLSAASQPGGAPRSCLTKSCVVARDGAEESDARSHHAATHSDAEGEMCAWKWRANGSTSRGVER